MFDGVDLSAIKPSSTGFATFAKKIGIWPPNDLYAALAASMPTGTAKSVFSGDIFETIFSSSLSSPFAFLTEMLSFCAVYEMCIRDSSDTVRR